MTQSKYSKMVNRGVIVLFYFRLCMCVRCVYMLQVCKCLSFSKQRPWLRGRSGGWRVFKGGNAGALAEFKDARKGMCKAKAGAAAERCVRSAHLSGKFSMCVRNAKVIIE